MDKFIQVYLYLSLIHIFPLTLTRADVTIKLDGTLRLTEDCDKNVRFEVLGYGWEE